MQSYRIAELIKQYTDYDMIRKHTSLPDFPEYRTRLLWAFLNLGTGQPQFSELAALVSSLVQMGLDTHDLVDELEGLEDDTDTEEKERSQQLKVLAGDYFSSRFYHLLAQAGQIDLIKHLSDAICEVNQLKATLYTKMKQFRMTSEEYLQQIVHIKSHLFLSLSEFMEDVYGKLWPEFIQSFTKCEVLIEELHQMDASESFSRGWAYFHVMQNSNQEDKKLLKDSHTDGSLLKRLYLKHNVKNAIYHMLDKQIQVVKDRLQHLQSEQWVQELYDVFEPLSKFVSKKQVLEEI